MLCIYFVSALQIKRRRKIELMIIFSIKQKKKCKLIKAECVPYGILQQVSDTLC